MTATWKMITFFSLKCTNWRFYGQKILLFYLFIHRPNADCISFHLFAILIFKWFTSFETFLIVIISKKMVRKQFHIRETFIPMGFQLKDRTFVIFIYFDHLIRHFRLQTLKFREFQLKRCNFEMFTQNRIKFEELHLHNTMWTKL